MIKILKQNRRPLYDERNPLNHCWSKVVDSLKSTISPSALIPSKDFALSSSEEKCFENLCFPSNHPGRLRDNTYFINKNDVLRPHMTLYTPEILKDKDEFFMCGEVFRRDKVDRTHFPVFHQIEAAKRFSSSAKEENICKDMFMTINTLLSSVLPNTMKWRWVTASFPFTEPSWEVEALSEGGEWIEILGCGILREAISTPKAWAFGAGLERITMLRHSIPDIRLFWSEDLRFLSQFALGDVVSDGDFVNLPPTPTKYKPFSRYPPIQRDVSFFSTEGFTENDLMELIRNADAELSLVEGVELVDRWKNSLCYRITFRSMHRTLTAADDVNPFMASLLKSLNPFVNLRV